MKSLIIVDHHSEWPEHLRLKSLEVCNARDYLSQEKYRKRRAYKVFNFCKSYRYQSQGYYVSLLAAGRGHKPVPSVTTIQDFKSPPLVRMFSEDLDQLIQSSLAPLKANTFSLSIYFGHNVAKKYDKLCGEIFKIFPSPLLRAQFVKTDKWSIQSVKPLALPETPASHKPDLVALAKQFFKQKSIRLPTKKANGYDLGILVDAAYGASQGDPGRGHANQSSHLSQNSPSDAKALKKIMAAALAKGLNPELITRDDYGRIAEFDGLFIRETTSVNHHTYRFARRAQAEGLVVIDDPVSILRCSNKIYLAEILESHHIRVPKTLILHRENTWRLQNEIGYPCILKQPDSAFSQGVKKAKNEEEMLHHLENFFAKSDLLIAQEYLPTPFDWRIGIIDKTPIYACQYHMARNHWQIVKTESHGKKVDGKVQPVTLAEVPKPVINVALKAANLIGDGLYGVDIKEVDGKPYVIEINDNPNIDAGCEDGILGDRLYEIIMTVFRDRIELKKNRAST